MIRYSLMHPAVLTPLIGGFGLFVFAMIIRRPVPLAMLGLAGMLAGVGVVLYRLLMQADTIAKQSASGNADPSDEDVTSRLALAHARLLEIGDEPGWTLADRLHQLRQRRIHAERDGRLTMPTEIARMIDDLTLACVDGLDRLAAMSVAAREMRSAEPRQQVRRAHHDLAQELESSVDQLTLTLDRLQAAALSDRPMSDHMAEVRDELALSLRIAKRVQQSLGGMELGHDPERG